MSELKSNTKPVLKNSSSKKQRTTKTIKKTQEVIPMSSRQKKNLTVKFFFTQGDRFIPIRSMEDNYKFLLNSHIEESKMEDGFGSIVNMNNYHNLMLETLFQQNESFYIDNNQLRLTNDRLLSFSLKNNQSNKKNNNLKSNIKNILDVDKRTEKRTPIPLIPERILDAPNLIDDYYLNLLDWSSTNILAVSLGKFF